MKTTTVQQLANISIIDLEGGIEDVMVSIDSSWYPTDFLVLEPKTKFNRYPLILERHFLATVNVYINCRVRNMTRFSPTFSI